MAIRLAAPVKAESICATLSLKLDGIDREIRELSSVDSLSFKGLSFVLSKAHLPSDCSGGTVFGDETVSADKVSVIRSLNPRLDFIRAQHFLKAAPGFVHPLDPPKLHPTVEVSAGAVIENGVEIGEGTRVGPCAVIRSGSRIGRHCEIKAGAVIGDSGFGFERDEQGRPIKMIHFGGVRIGDHVEVGALTTVCRGALGDTVLEDHVKLDDHVHIAHNCSVGEGTMITACAELSGSIKVGRGCWIAPNCSIAQKLTVGDGAYVGIGSVVVRNIELGDKVFGNPAKRVPGAAPHAAPQPHAAPRPATPAADSISAN